jgi:N-acetyl-gamma-glutamyl-phosphate reductase
LCIELVDEPEQEYELAFLCLPHEVSLELVPRLLDSGKRVIDLSGAYRIKNVSKYPEYYGFEHLNAHLLEEAVYGLPEIYRDDIKGARLVANPGCYPTASLIALYPLAISGTKFGDIVIHALSGISGAGKKLRQEFHYPEMTQSFFSYSVSKHRHTPEMEGILSELMGRDVVIRFTPTVVPASRGMLSTIYVKVEEEDISSLFRDAYSRESFVHIIDRPPNPKWVLGTNYCLIYTSYDNRSKILTLQSAIDNLGKGASMQAVQNMNIMFGLDEGTALDGMPLLP